MIKKLLFCFALLTSSLCADSKQTHPYQIVIFRHSEKVLNEHLDGPLNSQGQQRAAYLVHYLLSTIIDQDKHEIVAFYVPNPYANPPQYYIRPTQTILPLLREANLYSIEKTGKGVHLDQTFGYRDASSVFNAFLYNEKFASYEGKTVVICWEHKNLPHLFDHHFTNLLSELKHLGEDRYDTLWLIRWNGDTPTAQTLYQIPSHSFFNPEAQEALP